jgi:hypothetical protein
MAMICHGHSGHEFFGEQEVRDRIDVEDVAKLFLCFFEDGSADTNSGIVNQDCRLSMILSDPLCQSTDIAGVGDIYFIKVGIWRYT